MRGGKRPVCERAGIIRLKRVYETPAVGGGFRVLGERQRLKRDNKARAHLDLWQRGKAPSTDLRKWFAHDPAKWENIPVRYEKELRESTGLVRVLERKGREATVTLV